MSKILEENWEFLSRQHERFLEDPGYLHWLEQQEKLNNTIKWEEIHPIQLN